MGGGGGGLFISFVCLVFLLFLFVWFGVFSSFFQQLKIRSIYMYLHEKVGAIHSFVVERSLMVRLVVGSILHTH